MYSLRLFSQFRHPADHPASRNVSLVLIFVISRSNRLPTHYNVFLPTTFALRCTADHPPSRDAFPTTALAVAATVAPAKSQHIPHDYLHRFDIRLITRQVTMYSF